MRHITQDSSDETPFEFSELFISRTDKRGIIEFGNDVFYRVSGYAEGELLGQPHNKVRHSDMPKAVFKLFWQFLKRNEVIGAYVKNRSKDGRYYWVFATAFPTRDGYLSIRIKPSSPLFHAAKDLYGKILEHENKHGVEAAQKLLLESLAGLGFPNYESFMQKALREEILAKTQQISLANSNGQNLVDKPIESAFLDELMDRMIVASSKFDGINLAIQELDRLKAICDKQGDFISSTCEKLNYLAINMSVAAHKLGKDGAPLAVIANNFQKASDQILSRYQNFAADSQDLLGAINGTSFGANCLQIQTDMLKQFFVESDRILSKDKSVSGGSGSSKSQENSSTKEVILEASLILQIVKNKFEHQSNELQAFFALLQKIEKTVAQLKDLILQMDLIRTGGKLEGSRSTDTVKKFKPFLVDLEKLLVKVMGPITELNDQIRVSVQAFQLALLAITSAKLTISDIFLLLDAQRARHVTDMSA